jgi:PKD repeat protein
LLVAFAAASCGGSDGGTPPPDNQDPVAAFTAPACTVGVACGFTDASTDPDGNSTITTWAWDFGDDGTASEHNPQHTYAAAGDYSVSLTVTDDQSASNTVSHTVTVSETGTNQAPTAAFTVQCGSLDCTFADGSTDPNGNTDVTAWAWDFGDNATSTDQSPVHSYAATVPDTFSVRLIVTDAAGAKDTVTHDVTVAPPALCEGDTCDLTLEADAKVTVTLTSEDCNADGNTLIITSPVTDTLFTDGCHTAPGTSFDLDNGAVFTTGTKVTAEVLSGSQDLAFPPTIRLQAGSAYPTWVLEFDDGEAGANEPDFNDLIITITAHQ